MVWSALDSYIFVDLCFFNWKSWIFTNTGKIARPLKGIGGGPTWNFWFVAFLWQIYSTFKSFLQNLNFLPHWPKIDPNVQSGVFSFWTDFLKNWRKTSNFSAFVTQNVLKLGKSTKNMLKTTCKSKLLHFHFLNGWYESHFCIVKLIPVHTKKRAIGLGSENGQNFDFFASRWSKLVFLLITRMVEDIQKVRHASFDPGN